MKKSAVFCMVAVALIVACLHPAAFSEERKYYQIGPEAMDAARKAFVRVQVHVKKAERPEDVELQSHETDIPNLDSLISSQQTHDRVGIVLNDRGDILIPELRMDEANLDWIEIIDWSGDEAKAEIQSLYIDAPGMILQIKGDPLENAEAPDFKEPGPLRDEFLNYVFVHYAEDRWTLKEYEIFPSSMDFHSDEMKTHIFIPLYGSDMRLLFNKDENPVGLSMTPRVDDEESGGVWKGSSWRTGETISWTDYDEKRKGFIDAYDSVIHEVTFEFRKKTKKDSGIGGFFGRMVSAAEEQAEAMMKELKTYGPAVDEKLIFLPVHIPRERAKLLDAVTVKIGDQKKKARFLGCFQDFEGTLVELEEGGFSRVADLGAASEIERIKPFYVIRAKEKLGGKYMTCHFNRWLKKEKGYKNEYYWKPIYGMSKGDVILDEKGRLAGLWINLRKEGEDIRKAAQTESYSLFGREYFDSDWEWGGGYGNTVFFSAEKLQDVLDDPEAHYDPTIQSRTKEEERRKLWLGVEFDALNKELAESLEVEKPTLDGSIGLLVSRVYEGSPADEIGIKTGDVLLRLKPLFGTMESQDFKYNKDEFDMNFDEGDVPPELKSMGFKMPEKSPWRSRDNYLTKLLDAIGKGREIRLTYLSDGEEIQADLAIEEAPMDFDSAEKYKDKQLGLTVRNVTYEVRSALSMEDDDPGVVIAGVEEAEPAALARLKRYEIITKVDGEDVMNVEQFENKVKKAREEGRPDIQLQVKNLGKTRFADLKIE